MQAALTERCLPTLAMLRHPSQGRQAAGPALPLPAIFAPWGVQVSGNFSKAVALAGFQRVRARHAAIIGSLSPMVIGTRLGGRGTRAFYRVRLPAETRVAAETLCAKLRAADGACIVLKN